MSKLYKLDEVPVTMLLEILKFEVLSQHEKIKTTKTFSINNSDNTNKTIIIEENKKTIIIEKDNIQTIASLTKLNNAWFLEDSIIVKNK